VTRRAAVDRAAAANVRRRSQVRQSGAPAPAPDGGTPGRESSTGTAALGEAAQALIHGRHKVGIKQLGGPGPDAAQLDRLLRAAAAAPDHGPTLPWRFVLVPAGKRARLADAFAAARRECDPDAGPLDLALARQAAFRAPLLLLAVARLAPTRSATPPLERAVSLGCAIENLLLSAHAMGFASGLTGGPAMAAKALRELFTLAPDEQAACFVHVGTGRPHRPPRARPRPEDFLSEL